MNSLKQVIPVVLGASLLMACAPDQAPDTAASAGHRHHAAETPKAAERKVLFYRHPMRPEITARTPQRDEMGMDYIPVYESATIGGEVSLSPQMVNNLGVRIAPVTHGAAGGTVETVGVTAWDERRRVEVRVRAEGYVERLAVRAMGEQVRRGQMLFSVYSPKLAAAQRELQVARSTGDAELIAASEARLRALGIEPGAAPTERVNYTAPSDGVVMELGLREGGLAVPGMSAMTLTSTDVLWVIAEIPEVQSAGIAAGAAATVKFPALPGRQFEATVLELLPELNATTRTLQARLQMKNPRGQLAAGMVAQVALQGETEGHALMIPTEALIRSGQGERVIIALGKGRFVAREVLAGRESGARIEVLQGLDGSESVVVSGQFMIDSESQLRSSLARYEGEGS